MDKNAIDITRINEVELNMQEYFINEYIRTNISNSTLSQIRQELKDKWNNYSEMKFNDIISNFAFDVTLIQFRISKDINTIELLLKSEGFDNEIIIKSITKLKSMIAKARKSIFLDFVKEYVPFVTVPCVVVAFSLIRKNQNNTSGILIFSFSFWLFGALLYFVGKLLKKRNLAKTLGF
jgi:hypothetical protein